jgi:hypothetical protein
MPVKARTTADGVIFTVHVHPFAKGDMMDMTDGIEIYTREPPEGNKANIAVIKMLSKTLRVHRNRISIIRGATSRVKEVHIIGLGTEGLERLMQRSDRQ